MKIHHEHARTTKGCGFIQGEVFGETWQASFSGVYDTKNFRVRLMVFDKESDRVICLPIAVRKEIRALVDSVFEKYCK